MLVLTRRLGEGVVIETSQGERIEVLIGRLGPKVCSLRIAADPSIRVRRAELPKREQEGGEPCQ